MVKEKVLAGLITFGIILFFVGWITVMSLWPEASLVVVAGLLIIMAIATFLFISHIIYNAALTMLTERMKK